MEASSPYGTLLPPQLQDSRLHENDDEVTSVPAFPPRAESTLRFHLVRTPLDHRVGRRRRETRRIASPAPILS